jgi:hypothetical protein
MYVFYALYYLVTCSISIFGSPELKIKYEKNNNMKYTSAFMSEMLREM